MQKGKLILTCVSLVLAIGLGYVVGSKQSGKNLKVPVVRSYTVPSGRAEEVRNSLNKLFWQQDGQAPLGTAQIFGDGLMLVRAPEGFQNGVGNLVAKLTSLQPQASNTIHIDYWLVMGEQAAESNSDSIKLLSTVLSSIDKLDGPRKFRILEHIAANTLSNSQEVRIKGSIVELKERAKYVDNHILLDTYASSHLGEINADTQMNLGDYVVLGENSLKPKDVQLNNDNKFSGPEDETQTNVYHIIHVDALK